MKLVVLFVAVLAKVAAIDYEIHSRSPVEKVVELIEELKANMEADFAADQKLYDYFACWCETTSDKKAKAITDAKDSLEEMGKKVLELKGKVAELSADVAQLTGDIQDNEKDQKELTETRQKENAAYMAERTELEQAGTALEKAMHMLGVKIPKAEKKSAAAAGLLQAEEEDSAAEEDSEEGLLQADTGAGEFARLQVIANLRTALQTFPVHHVTVSPKELAMVELFTREYDPDEKYKPQSKTINKILKQIYKTFMEDLSERNKEEGKSQKAYEDLIASKTKALKHDLDQIKEKNGEKAEAEVQLADLAQQLEDTTKEIKTDIEFFGTMKEACTSKAEEWEERSSAYTDELKGVKEALKILTSDEAREMFSKATSAIQETTFLQTSIEANSSPQQKAYDVLKRQAANAKSMRLASVAAAVKMATSGKFDEVLDKIDEIIGVLKDEEEDDTKQRDWCKDEYQQNDLEKGETKWLIEQNEAEIVKHEKIIEKLEAELEQVTKQMTETNEQMESMKKERKDEKDEFEQKKKDDEAAIKLLKKAKEVLSKFHKEDEKLFLQKPASGDAMPDATFVKKDANKNASKGIVGIMEIIIEDLQGEIKTGEANEEAAIKEFKKNMKAAKELLEALKEKKTDIKSDLSKTNEKKESEEKDLENNNDDLKSNEEYRKEITPDCDWLFGAYDERRKMRAQEMDGLVKAKEFLAGASLLAKKSQVHQANQAVIKSTEASLDHSAKNFLHASKSVWLPKK